MCSSQVIEILVASHLEGPQYSGLDYSSEIAQAIRKALELHGVSAAQISVLLTNDAESHTLNVRHLAHDYPTDVITFPLSEEDELLQGEIVINADYAARGAKIAGWSTADEIVLYAIHGTLHLVGFEDDADEQRHKIRQAEIEVLSALGRSPHGVGDHVIVE